jgi:HK97 family phage portal protein
MQTFANSLYANGINPSGALQLDGKLTDEQLRRYSEQFRQAFAGPTKAAKAMVLDQGAKWETISISPEDAEFLESRKFTTEELARIFNVPPPMIGDLSHGTFTNTETMVRLFATNTLTPWVRKLESEFTRSVFSQVSRKTHKL